MQCFKPPPADSRPFNCDFDTPGWHHGVSTVVGYFSAQQWLDSHRGCYSYHHFEMFLHTIIDRHRCC
jgi:hypothetical protein